MVAPDKYKSMREGDLKNMKEGDHLIKDENGNNVAIMGITSSMEDFLLPTYPKLPPKEMKHWAVVEMALLYSLELSRDRVEKNKNSLESQIALEFFTDALCEHRKRGMFALSKGETA